MATHTMMAGLLGTAGVAGALRYGGGAYDWLTGADKPHDYSNDLRRFLTDIAGPTVGEMLAHGLPAGLGIDVHRRIGTADLLAVPQLKDFSTQSMMAMIGMALTGAAGENAMGAVAGAFKLAHGDMSGLKAIAPRPLAEAGKAYLLAAKGVTDSKGKEMVSPDKVTPWQVAVQAAGFQPSMVTEARAARNAILEAKTEAATGKRKAIAEWTAAMEEGDKKTAAEAVKKFNTANPRNKITMDQLLQARKRERDAAKHPERMGLTLPKKTAKDLVQAGRFANY